MDDQPKSQWKLFLRRCLDWIAFFSIGKYSTKLYHQGRSEYSCWFSGLITLVLTILCLLSAVSILGATISKEVYTITEYS